MADTSAFIKIIKEEFPGISDEGVASIMGNIELESGGGKAPVEIAMTLEQKYSRHSKDVLYTKSDKEDLTKAGKWDGTKMKVGGVRFKKGSFVYNHPSHRKNLVAAGYGDPKDLTAEKKAEWNALSNDEKNGVLYNADSTATYSGGFGPLQITLANYGGLENRKSELEGVMKDMKFEGDFNAFMKKIKDDPSYGLKATLNYYKKAEPDKFNTTWLNKSTSQGLGDTVINPYRKSVSTEKWQRYQAAGVDSVAAYNNIDFTIPENKKYEPVLTTTTEESTDVELTGPGELTQEQKDKIADDIKPTVVDPSKQGQFGDIVLCLMRKERRTD